jgi:uncharacterized membrane protein
MVSVSWLARPSGKGIGLFGILRLEKHAPLLDKRPKSLTDIIKVGESKKFNCNGSLIAVWAESFVFAGSSALLLLLANFSPIYWYFSFFALVPFLYRIIKATPTESLRLGILFGISFFAVSMTDSLSISPIPSLLKLFLGTGLFAVFGWTVGWARKHWGFNPILVALLWAGLEVGLIRLGFAGGLFGAAKLTHPFMHGLIALFGFFTVSAVIVLLNSLLVLAITKALELTRPKGKLHQKDKGIGDLFFIRHLFAERVHLVPENRAPPIH